MRYSQKSCLRLHGEDLGSQTKDFRLFLLREMISHLNDNDKQNSDQEKHIIIEFKIINLVEDE